MNKVLIVLFLLLLYTRASAQYPKEFPADNAGFGKAYSEFIKTCTRDDCKQVAEKFPASITSGKASAYFVKVKAITQSMLVKKAAAYPVFLQFAQVLMTLDG